MSKITKNRRLLIGYGATLIFACVIVWYIHINWGEFAKIQLERPLLILPLVVAIIYNLISMGMLMDVILKPLKISLGTSETFGLSSITRFSNYIAPLRLGFTVRAAYLKKTYNLPISHFFASISAIHILFYIATSVLGLFSLLSLYLRTKNFNLTLFILLAGFSVSLLAILMFRPKFNNKKNYLTRYVSKIIEGWNKIHKDQSVIRRTAIWGVHSALAFALMVYLEFQAFGFNIGFDEAILIMSVNALNAVLGITPGGFGISEGLTVFASQTIGLPGNIALATALLRRLVVFSVTGILSIYYSRKLFDKSLVVLYHSSTKNNTSNSLEYD